MPQFLSCRRGFFLFVQTSGADERANHKSDASDDEGQAEELSHVERHAFLEVHLFFLDEFDEEAEGEDEGEAKSGMEAGAGRNAVVRLLALDDVDGNAYEEYNKVCQCFVELCRMAGHCHSVDQCLVGMEDESPGHIGGLADDFGVHEVAGADATGCERCGDAHVVEHCGESHSVSA